MRISRARKPAGSCRGLKCEPDRRSRSGDRRSQGRAPAGVIRLSFPSVAHRAIPTPSKVRSRAKPVNIHLGARCGPQAHGHSLSCALRCAHPQAAPVKRQTTEKGRTAKVRPFQRAELFEPGLLALDPHAIEAAVYEIGRDQEEHHSEAQRQRGVAMIAQRNAKLDGEEAEQRGELDDRVQRH